MKPFSSTISLIAILSLALAGNVFAGTNSSGGVQSPKATSAFMFDAVKKAIVAGMNETDILVGIELQDSLNEGTYLVKVLSSDQNLRCELFSVSDATVKPNRPKFSVTPQEVVHCN